jgi:hypothetical protein
MKLKLLAFLFFGFCLSGCATYINTISLSAPGGDFEKTEADIKPTGHLEMVLNLTNLKKHSSWAPNVMVSLSEEDKVHSLRVYLSRIEPTNDYLTAGYLYIKNGEIIDGYNYPQKFQIGVPVKLKLDWQPVGGYQFSLGDQLTEVIDIEMFAKKIQYAVGSGDATIELN